MTGTRRHLTTDYPHLDPAWGEDLLVALRVREVSGARIGQILAEADAHCAQTNESAPEAFGPASQYAARLDFPGQDRAPVPVTRSTIGMLGAQLVGAALTTLGGNALIEGTQVQVRAADLLVAGLVLLATWVAYRRLEQLLRHAVLGALAMGLTCAAFLLVFLWGGHGAIAGSDAVVTRGSLALAVASLAVLTVVLRWFDVVLRHPWWGWVGGTAAYLLAVTTMLRLWPEAAVSLPAGAVLGVGAVAMLVAAVWATRTARSPLPDLIVRPGDAPERRDLRAATAVQVAAVWLLPALMAGLLASMWLASR